MRVSRPHLMVNSGYISVMMLLAVASGLACAEETSFRSVSGVYPHLAFWNSQGECGTGAVVPWAGKLWAITYSPHYPQGSDDKLYMISPDLEMQVFESSVGGTPANRMIHRETDQLIIGPYLIDAEGNVRVIPPSKMYGRLTGTARHLFDPDSKVYYATMEEGFYEVDVSTLEVNELFRDDQHGAAGGRPNKIESQQTFARLPGYHGKGLYSGQGRLIYANNGENSREARRRPDVPSGCLAEWDGKSEDWTVVRRNQFTDVSGPGGLYGNPNSETDPVWAIGWDHRSLLLMLLDDGRWHTYRLPKATHTYDGAHGWNTEWPRFRDIGEKDLAMNMHGMFWRFPRSFSHKNSAGIRPRSTYLKVVGDYCRWNDKLVFGCDDTAKNEFLNKRRAKGGLESPGQSHSNLWFTEPSILDELGPVLGRGAVWSKETVSANTPSEPYLFQGFERRGLHLCHQSAEPVVFTLEIDKAGNNQWEVLDRLKVPANSALWHSFPSTDEGVWVRIKTDRDCQQVTAQFQYSNRDRRPTTRSDIFRGLADPDSSNFSGGIVYVRGNYLKTLGFAAAQVVDGKVLANKYYELDSKLQLKLKDEPDELLRAMHKNVIPLDVLTLDKASVIYVDDDNNRWRLPRGNRDFDSYGLLEGDRVDREVATERDLFNCHGTFYELPARNAGGFSKIRPICSHNLRIKDYCSYRGMLILSGVAANAPSDNQHIIRSDDGKVALWAGVVDDLWKLGKPVGIGGPWLESHVQVDEPSDPYLMTGYDKKAMSLSHRSSEPVAITIQVDVDGTGTWVDYKTYDVSAGETLQEDFPEGFSAYWVRALCDRDTVASVVFDYE